MGCWDHRILCDDGTLDAFGELFPKWIENIDRLIDTLK